MLTLGNLWTFYLEHFNMRRVDSLEKTLILGGTGGRRKRGRQRMRWLDGVTDSVDVSLSETPGVGDRVAWRAVIHEVAKSWTRLSNWTDWTEKRSVFTAHWRTTKWKIKLGEKAAGVITVTGTEEGCWAALPQPPPEHSTFHAFARQSDWPSLGHMLTPNTKPC